MGILDDNYAEGTPEENFVLDVAKFAQTYDHESWMAMTEYVRKNCKKITGKLCWKKYHYFAISRNVTDREWIEKTRSYKEVPAKHKIIIASESYFKDSWGRGQCVVFRCTGKTGPKEKRGQWYNASRDSFNPILSSGWKFSEYDIYEIPTGLFEYLWAFLPHQKTSDNN